ncbi:hypothetical protein SUGI_0651980 [Cryptomeria japonica]|nr:hypothetical protein SUGI_0651980 [Cryptomeria japonica]
MADEVKDHNLCRAEILFKLQNSKSKSEGTVWDCDSTLYDSFELRSFSFQLTRALTVVSSSSPPDAPLRPKAGSCFRSFSDRRNVEEIDYNPQSRSENLAPKRKSLASWSIKKLVGAFHRKSKEDKIL